MARLGVLILLALLGAVAAQAQTTPPPAPRPRLRFGFYKHSCPPAEVIVRDAVRNAIIANPGLGDSFKVKGLDIDDLVVLSGSHTIGRSHCSSFSDRLTSSGSDMDPGMAFVLKGECPANPNFTNDPTVVQDFVTPDKLDNQYYKNVLNHKVLFNSDAALLTSTQTARKVVENAFVRGRWEKKFAKAMVKMAAVEVKTAANGEVRRNCRVVN